MTPKKEKKEVEEEEEKVETPEEKAKAKAEIGKEEGKLDKIETITQTKRLNKKYGKVATIELKQRDPYIPRAVETKLRGDIKKMKAITPNELAQKYDVRVSTMKHFLEALVAEGVLVEVSTSDRLKIFNPI
jgi:ribosomal protein S25